jgi:hypothetical protein
MLDERIKVTVRVEEFVTTIEARRRNQRVDGFAGSNAMSSEQPIVASRANGTLVPAKLDYRKSPEQRMSLIEILVAGDALQDLRQDQVADDDPVPIANQFLQ